ncbi:IclR family transcriptional regulator [Streptomyces sp. NPDC005480]|uniref:IclR family transcriptional regulator n=1 Tax=Streptomyces sp. NPDC005480 TaxID=3154880 RepID=UPI0033BD6CF9
MPHSAQPGRSVSARLLDVLFAFRPGRPQLSLAELTRETGLPHATVHRLTRELVRAGALDRSPDGAFTVGLRLWQLGTLAPLSASLRAVALPFMDDLHTALRQHVQLSVLEGAEAVLVERLSAGRAVDVVSRLGGRLPLHSSGVGKVLLAHADHELLDRILAQDLPAYTGRTVTAPDQLRAQLAACRESGVAVVREETTAGVDSVGTRILDSEGQVVAALSVVVASGSVDLHAVRPALIASGLAVSRRLGWHPSAGVQVTGPSH